MSYEHLLPADIKPVSLKKAFPNKRQMEIYADRLDQPSSSVDVQAETTSPMVDHIKSACRLASNMSFAYLFKCGCMCYVILLVLIIVTYIIR